MTAVTVAMMATAGNDATTAMMATVITTVFAVTGKHDTQQTVWNYVDDYLE